MERHLRARHARTWVLLGPLLLIAVFAMLWLRPRVEPVAHARTNSAPSAGAAP